MPTIPKKPNQNDSGSNEEPNKIPNNDNNRPKKPKIQHKKITSVKRMVHQKK